MTFFETVSDFGIWSLLEPGMGIVANSLATLRPMMRSFMQRTRSIYSKRGSGGAGASEADFSGNKSSSNSSQFKNGANNSGSAGTHQDKIEETQLEIDGDRGASRGVMVDEEKGFKQSEVMIQERNGSSGRLAIMTRTDVTVNMQLGVLPSPPPSSDWQQPHITGLGSNRLAAKSEPLLPSIAVPFRPRTDA